jgi:hypothetical protein
MTLSRVADRDRLAARRRANGTAPRRLDAPLPSSLRGLDYRFRTSSSVSSTPRAPLARSPSPSALSSLHRSRLRQLTDWATGVASPAQLHHGLGELPTAAAEMWSRMHSVFLLLCFWRLGSLAAWSAIEPFLSAAAPDWPAVRQRLRGLPPGSLQSSHSRSSFEGRLRGLSGAEFHASLFQRWSLSFSLLDLPALDGSACGGSFARQLSRLPHVGAYATKNVPWWASSAWTARGAWALVL